MSELQSFCYQASYRVMQGLAQELNIRPYHHYRPSGHNTARVLSLRLVSLNPHYLKQILRLRNELTMWAGMSDKYKVRIGWDGQGIIIELPKPPKFWQQVTIEQLESRHFLRRGPIVTLGLGLQDDPKRVNFTEPATGHVLITGLTRSGKTNAARLTAWNVCHNTTPQDARLLILDVAKRAFKWADFQNVDHLAHPIITDLQEADRALCWLTQEIERRAEQSRLTPRLFVMIDELKALMDDSPVAAAYLARIASTGGEFGLHLILTTQYPQVQMLKNAELKRNVATRLCGRVDDANAAANALGVANSGAELLCGYGDFLLRDFTGLYRLTVAKLEPHHVEELPRSEIKLLDLPHLDDVQAGPKLVREPDPVEPEQVAVALFNPIGINRLQRELQVGGSKATRIKNFADRIRNWAQEHGVERIPFHSSQI
ncbi:MAG: hypothetical protein JXM69_15325 [Anaerolineae bacterium]|nr:hypothetical protein [Anaerolineae bacterium]